ncbi:hypothetical protein FRC03_002769 [Tulasnella sp. 419]|nr:hypothetical protein FRC02_003606 [Tulasnella sp. 418]KAG8963622.1 hypothetical protein FRC03_002769 [Tulasnella sp. 419]
MPGIDPRLTINAPQEVLEPQLAPPSSASLPIFITDDNATSGSTTEDRSSPLEFHFRADRDKPGVIRCSVTTEDVKSKSKTGKRPTIPQILVAFISDSESGRLTKRELVQLYETHFPGRPSNQLTWSASLSGAFLARNGVWFLTGKEPTVSRPDKKKATKELETESSSGPQRRRREKNVKDSQYPRTVPSTKASTTTKKQAKDSRSRVPVMNPLPEPVVGFEVTNQTALQDDQLEDLFLRETDWNEGFTPSTLAMQELAGADAPVFLQDGHHMSESAGLFANLPDIRPSTEEASLSTLSGLPFLGPANMTSPAHHSVQPYATSSPFGFSTGSESSPFPPTPPTENGFSRTPIIPVLPLLVHSSTGGSSVNLYAPGPSCGPVSNPPPGEPRYISTHHQYYLPGPAGSFRSEAPVFQPLQTGTEQHFLQGDPSLVDLYHNGSSGNEASDSSGYAVSGQEYDWTGVLFNQTSA